MEREDEKSENGFWKAVIATEFKLFGIGTARSFGVVCLTLVVIIMVIAQRS